MINEFEVRERVDRFIEEHGDYIAKGGWIYHQDGATRDINALGPLIPPPSQPRELYRNLLAYQEEKLRREIEEFDRFKAQLEQNPYGSGDPEQELEQLKSMRDAAIERQKLVEEIREKLRQQLPGYRTPEEIASDAAREDAKEKRRQKVREISL